MGIEATSPPPMVLSVDGEAASAPAQHQQSSGSQQLPESENPDRSRQKRKVSHIPSNGRNARSESLKKTRVGLNPQQECETNRAILLRYGMDSEKQKKMEAGLNVTEIINKQKFYIKRATEVEQVTENARRASQK